MTELGFCGGKQRLGELLASADWGKLYFRRFICYCHTANAFQDAPFSFPYTYQAIDTAFPGSKFILTVRDNADQWYSSITRFHSKIWGNGRVPPTKQDLQSAIYLYRGWPWEANRLLFDSPEEEPYKKENLVAHYNRHNSSVIEYFSNRPNDLLVLNVAEKGAYKRLCDFLDKPCNREEFPWENRT